MKCEFSINNDDLLAFQLYFLKHSKFRQRQIQIVRIVFPIIYIIMAAALFNSNADPVAYFFLVVAVLWYLCIPGYYESRVRRELKKFIREIGEDYSREPVTVELLEDGIFTTSFRGESKYRYASVDRIVENNGYTYVFVGKGMALILPHNRIPKDRIDLIVAEIERNKMSAA